MLTRLALALEQIEFDFSTLNMDEYVQLCSNVLKSSQNLYSFGFDGFTTAALIPLIQNNHSIIECDALSGSAGVTIFRSLLYNRVSVR